MNVGSGTDRERYVRQDVLPGFGPAGTRRVQSATVAVSTVETWTGATEWVARYLLAAGLGRLRLVGLDSTFARRLPGCGGPDVLTLEDGPADLRVLILADGVVLELAGNQPLPVSANVRLAGARPDPAAQAILGTLVAARALGMLAGVDKGGDMTLNLDMREEAGT